MRTAQWNKERKCENCGRSFFAARSDARSCRPACKKALQRKRLTVADVPFMAAAEMRLDLCELWPQGLEVKCEFGRYVKPGRVDWKAKPLGDCSKLVPVNLGFTWEWVHPCRLLNMRRRP